MSDRWRTLTGMHAHLEDPDRPSVTMCGRPIMTIDGGAGVSVRVRAPEDARLCSRCSGLVDNDRFSVRVE